jgi:hypothetical protein
MKFIGQSLKISGGPVSAGGYVFRFGCILRFADQRAFRLVEAGSADRVQIQMNDRAGLPIIIRTVVNQKALEQLPIGIASFKDSLEGAHQKGFAEPTGPGQEIGYGSFDQL